MNAMQPAKFVAYYRVSRPAPTSFRRPIIIRAR
jgi:hypothetical protein